MPQYSCMLYTVICLIFVKIISFGSQQMKIIYTNIMLHWKIFTMNIWKNESFMVRIIEFTCMCPAVCRLYLFPCHNWGYVHLSLFQSNKWTCRSKGITIAKYIICLYSFRQSGSAESDQSHKEIDETWSIHKVGRIGVSWDTNDLLLTLILSTFYFKVLP